MFIELSLLLITVLVVLYFKFVYISLPDHAGNKILLQFIILVNFLVQRIPHYFFKRFDVKASTRHKWTLGVFRLSNLARAAHDKEVGITNTTFEGVPVRIYSPALHLRKQDGCLLFIHGGGWCTGTAVMADGTCNRLVKATGMHVVSIDYRLSPEYHFPIPVNDCETAAVHYLKEAAAKLNLDPKKTVVLGDSAGGNLTAVLAHRLNKRTDVPKLMASVLIYPVIQGIDFTLPSWRYEQDSNIGLLTAYGMMVFTVRYLNIKSAKDEEIFSSLMENGHVTDSVKKHANSKYIDYKLLPKEWTKDYKKTPIKLNKPIAVASEKLIMDPDYSPIFNEHFTGLPPTLTLTVEFDVLRDEGYLYHAQMKSKGVEAEWIHYDGAFHGHLSFPSKTSDKMIDDIKEFVQKQLKNI